MKELMIHVSFPNEVKDDEARRIVNAIVTGIQNDLLLAVDETFGTNAPTAVRAGRAVLRVEPRE